MSRGMTTRTRGAAGFPRVSGDEPPQMSMTLSLTEFSPRERG